MDHHTERRLSLGTVWALVKRTSKIQGGRMWTFLSKFLPMTVNQHFKHPRSSRGEELRGKEMKRKKANTMEKVCIYTGC